VRLGISALALLLLNSVVELKFRRRIEKAGYTDYRRMLCTNDRLLLNSPLGRNLLNYNPPTGQGLKYNPAAKNLIPTWDVFLQDYRMINCNDVEVISVIKTSPDATEFWKYFNESLLPMSSQQKAHFINV
jgi:hypothetical protein